MLETCVQSLGEEDPLEKGWATHSILGFLGGSDGKKSTCNAGDLGLNPELGRSPGGGHDNFTVVLLPGEFPWTEEPGRLQSMFMGSQRVRQD